MADRAVAGKVETLAQYVVAVGASAGGLDALERLFGQLPARTPLAFVVAQHLSPDHKSMMVELLRKRTALKVAEAIDGARLYEGTVHLVPSHANVVVVGDHLELAGRAEAPTLNLPVDQLMRSLASSYGPRSVAVILSGTGSDGREGVLSIKAAGGAVLVQDPSSAGFDGMPREAIRTGVVDAVVPPEGLASELDRIASDRALLERLTMSTEPNGSFERVAIELRNATGLDLSSYKLSTVLRRLERRVAARSARDLDEYVAILHEDPAEARMLVAEILINVTEMFRDLDVFQALENRYLPELRGKIGNETLRVWVPGCSSGEEAFSLAILLAESQTDFKIFGTDIDGEALAKATAAVYGPDALEGLSEERRQRFFVRRDGGYEVDRELRKHVVFASHDLLSAPPFTRMHLVSCRNLLIYLTPEAQRRALDAISFALKPGGLLVLGKSEVIGQRFDELKTLDSPLKIFSRCEGRRSATSLMPRLRRATAGASPVEPDSIAAAATRILVDRVAESALLVDERLQVVRVFGNAGRLLRLPIGEPTLDLGSLVPEDIRSITLAAVHRALSTNEDTHMAPAEREAPVAGITAIPYASHGAGRYVVVVLDSRTAVRGDALPPTEGRSEVAALERELLTARQSLQTAIEQLETANEELQATNEELLASNEELQATNEELQSVNEELHTVNVEHQARITELSETNADLDNLLNATPVATVFLDEKLRLRRFNPPAVSLFPFVESDRGRPLSHFTSSLTTTVPLAIDLEPVLERGTPLEREITTTQGKRYYLRAVPHLGAQRRICGVVLTLSDVTALHATKESQRLLQGVIDGIVANVAVLDDQGVIQFVNESWTKFGQVNEGHGSHVGTSYLDACRTVPEIRTALEAVLARQRDDFECVYPCHSRSDERWYLMHARRTGDGSHTVVSHTNVTSTRKSVS
ncbi:MAG: chemotaxis protein CheB [Polyangiaceae bacterium]